jgi:pyruvate,orthophosphate dikinase
MKMKRVFFFGGGRADGNAQMKELLGGKGANLAEMTNLGLPVPPGFTITTEVCDLYYKEGRKLPAGLDAEVSESLARLEDLQKTKFGDGERPLLVSVRSGAASSMPGMMDTILNLGLTSRSVQGLARWTSNERFAWDAYRRLVNMFGNVVMGMGHDAFEHEMSALKARVGAKQDTDLTAAHLKELTERYKGVYQKATGESFPEDPRAQLSRAIEAVFRSWMNERAVKYRAIHKITGLLGTAVNVQAMVFGNTGEGSGTGVCFTRNPATGDPEFYGEFLFNAQGEDVVAGIRTPLPIERLKERLPDCYQELLRYRELLEKHYRDLQDIEFTIQDGKLYVLQTRNGKRTGRAAVKIAVDLHREGLVDAKGAVKRVSPQHLDQVLHPTFDPKAPKKVIGKGLPASPGAATGRVVFFADDAEAWAKKGEKVLLVRHETSPEDVGGMHAAQGILTAVGGLTSHAAIVARGMGKTCVVGCGDLHLDLKGRRFTAGGTTVSEGDWLSIDGGTGQVILGQVPTVQPTTGGDLEKLLGFADQLRRLRVRANADTPEDARVARKFGAEGIGLCRTEHMFFAPDRIAAVREMILASDRAARERALAKLLPMQRSDFEGIFREMDGLPVTIRLLDPPLHEFLPKEPENQREMAQLLGIKPEEVARKVEQLTEVNPMLGHRGCRLGVTYPEIYRMQIRAILEAARTVHGEGRKVLPEIMIPLVGTRAEFTILLEDARAVEKEVRGQVPYKIGTMIEVPRAALAAREIAQEAEFFSFGTNDLTQMTFGFSRDDIGVFLPVYLEKGVLPEDPFQSLDPAGVGRLVELATREGREARADLKVGICGEHGGDPASIRFCHRVGLDYVSCSPFRVPIARLAAAHAALE